MEATKLNDEVYLARSPIGQVTRDDIQFLKNKAMENPRGKCRLLLHQNVDDVFHEMVIVHTQGKYIRPLKNVVGGKSFSVIEGAFSLVSFDGLGNVVSLQNVGEYSAGGVFTVRISDNRYHTLVNLTRQVVFIETCLGPFKGSEFAPWAPEEGTVESVSYYDQLSSVVLNG